MAAIAWVPGFGFRVLVPVAVMIVLMMTVPRCVSGNTPTKILRSHKRRDPRFDALKGFPQN